MKSIFLILCLILYSSSVFSFKDDSHYSKTFGKTRFFRVFTPPGYNPADCTKRYPVIYYFHGCFGSYERSEKYSYGDYGLKPPVAVNRTYNKAYEYPNNADFENVALNNDVIIICADGKIEDLPDGCGVFFPSLANQWTGNYYNFSVYIRELISVVDDRYNTKSGPNYRAISGLSMGGQMAIWVAATNPHLFSSASEFCHSPTYYDVGEPAYTTTIDVKQLWRNLRGVPFRHSTTDRDYLRYYTEQLYSIYSGAGFENQFYLADYCKHHAARIDLQFDFHMKHFGATKQNPRCFSFINLYPDFEVWGYNISSYKKGNGWIYLHDVTKNGLGIYTRKNLPWGNGLAPFNISVISPAIYIPGESYNLSRYSYSSNSFTSEYITADSLGRLTVLSSGGIGEEVGINGKELQPPVFVMTDTVNENIYLENNVETSLSFDVINLSASSQTVNFNVTTENNELLSIIKGPKQVKIAPKSRKRIDSFIVCKGKYLSLNSTAYIKISSSIDGITQDREQIIQVNITNHSQPSEHSAVKIFDGKSENLALFKYVWNGWNHPVSSGIISEGSGNGNGKAEIGETFSMWVQLPSAYDTADINTWHPVIPINNKNNPDISLVEIKQHLFNTGRAVFSAQIRLNRSPTKRNPIRIPIQSELLKVQPLVNDCHRGTADNFTYFYDEIIINADGTTAVNKKWK